MTLISNDPTLTPPLPSDHNLTSLATEKAWGMAGGRGETRVEQLGVKGKMWKHGVSEAPGF